MVATVVTIGGAPGSGKSTLARALADHLGYESLTVDDLLTAIRAVTTPQTHQALHPSAGAGHLEYFTHTPPGRLVEDAVALEQAAWPAVRSVIRRHLRERQPVVLDWWLLHPIHLTEFDGSDVAGIWLSIDPAALERRERALEGFRAGSDDPDLMHANFMARSLWRNDLVRAEAERLEQLHIHQPGERSVAGLVEEVCRSIGAPS